MKSLLIAIATIFSITNKTCGQPSGGGGIIIQNFIDKEGNLISSIDSSLIIRKFILSDTGGLTVKEYYKKDESISFEKHASIPHGGLYIPSSLGILQEIKMPHQLIQFAYKGDTTFVEFVDIMKQGMGISNFLDTLQLMPGYFRISFNILKGYYIKNGTAGDNRKFDSIQNLVYRGLTTTTLPILQPLGVIGRIIDKKFTTIYLHNNHTYDTVYLPIKPVYCMSVKSITLGSNSVSIYIDEPPMIEKDTLLYRILMNVPPFRMVTMKNKANDEQDEQQKTIAFIRALTTKTLYVNDQFFSGCLKVFIPFSDYAIGGVINSGFGLSILYFYKGKLIRQEDIPDIELDETDIPKRLS